MGCMSAKSHQALTLNTTSEQSCPPFAESQFHATLYNVKILGRMSPEDFTLRFDLLKDRWELYSRKAQREANTLCWANIFHTKLLLSSTTAESKKLFISLQSSGMESIPAIIQVDLPLILNGPIHHNFKIKLHEEYHILFDLKVSQMIRLGLKVLEAEVRLKQQHPGEQFLFSCRTRSDDDSFAHSSYAITAPLNTFSKSSQPACSGDEFASPYHLQPCEKTAPLIWKQAPLPSFPIHILVSDLSKQQIQFLLWGVVHGTEIEEEAILMGDAAFPLWKLMDRSSQIRKMSQDTTISKDYSELEERERCVKLDAPLTLHEKTIGEITLVFRMSNPAYITQKKYLTRTGQGVTTLLASQKADTLSALATSLTRDIHPVQKLFKIQQQLTLLQDRLSKSNPLLVLKTPKQAEELTASQNKMLNILEALCAYAAIEDNSDTAYRFWQLIVLILQRKEFQLQQLTPQNNANPAKKLIADRFRTILLSLLAVVLQENNDESKFKSGLYYECICTFKAYCFLRIPFFNTLLLNTICHAGGSLHLQNSIVQLNKNQFCSIPQTVTKRSWEQFFNESESVATHKKDVEDAFKRSEWVGRLQKKQDEFFGFVSKVTTKPLPKCQETYSMGLWKEQLQSEPLIVAFLYAMQKCQVKNYSPQLIKTSIELLKREALLNIYMRLVTERTSVYSTKEAIFAMNHLFDFFAAVTKQGSKAFFQFFDEQLLFQIVESVVESDHHMLKNELMKLIFYFYNCFSNKFKRTLTLYLLGKAFFGLFFFWSPQVRYTFYQFLIVKVSKALSNTQLHTRYVRVLELAFAAKEVHHKETINAKVYKNQIYFKQMRIKKIGKMSQCLDEPYTDPYSLANLYTFIAQQNFQLQHFASAKECPTQLMEPQFKHTSSHTPTKAKKHQEGEDNEDPEKENDVKRQNNREHTKEYSQTEKKRKRRYTEINLDYQLYTSQELKPAEKRVINQACLQFRKIEKIVQQYKKTHKKLPTVLFDWQNGGNYEP